MKVTIKIFQDEQEVVAKTLEEGTFKIGRSDSCDINLSDERVSRSHLEVRVTDSSIYFTNLSGSGKVFKDGQPSEAGELANGDQLVIASYKILFFTGTGHQIEPFQDGQAQAEPSAMEEGPGEMEAGQDAGMGVSADAFGAGGEDAFQADAENGLGQVSADAFEVGGNDFGAQPQEADFGQNSPQVAVAVEEPQVEGTAALAMNETQLQMKPLVAKLIFTEGPMKGQEFFLETYEITLGRSRKADIFIDDPRLSRIHAKITRMGMGYRLIDMSSRNGTYVNGMRILEHPLNSYDVLGLGQSKIKFIIHDMIPSSESTRASSIAAVGSQEQTKSLMRDAPAGAEIADAPPFAQPPIPYQAPGAPPVPPGPGMPPASPAPGKSASDKRSKLMRLAAVALIALGVVYLVLPETPTQPTEETPAVETAQQKAAGEGQKQRGDVSASAPMPQEYYDLSEEAQRAIEGSYTTARRAMERKAYEEALYHLNKIHDVLPYYKRSQEFKRQVEQSIKKEAYREAQEEAKADSKRDLVLYLEEGIQYLKVGDFDRAAEAFNSAIVIDPENEIAKTGLRAAEFKIRDINKVPKEQDPEVEKRKQVLELFQIAVAAFANKSYQEAIDTAEQIRQIELRGDTQYLSEAKQIIDRARMLQKEEFEPFLIQAKEKYVEGDYNASRDLCEEMLNRDPSYEPAKGLLTKNKKKLNILAKEAYVTGYILESMGKIDEAKQYWNRAKNFVRPGDPYYEKVNKMLDKYQ